LIYVLEKERRCTRKRARDDAASKRSGKEAGDAGMTAAQWPPAAGRRAEDAAMGREFAVFAWAGRCKTASVNALILQRIDGSGDVGPVPRLTI